MIGRTNTGGGKGGGGGALNFRVLSGLTEPISPKKNDIWVYSDVDVTAYAFSGSEPSIKTLNCSVETASSHIVADGTIVSKVAYGITGYLELPENSKTIIVTSCDVNSTDVYHEFYDKNKNSISRVQRNKNVTTYDVPQNAAYVRLSRYIVTANSDSDSATVTIDDGITKEGAVWIFTGASSPVEFNALKKNGITVYPISAKQYVDGAWVDKTAKSYQNGAWVDWITYLFKEGSGAEVEFGITGSTINIGTDGIAFSGSSSKGLYADVAVTLEKTSTFCVEATITNVGTSDTYMGSVVAKTPSVYSSTRNDHPQTATARAKISADGVRTVYKLSLGAGTYHFGVSGNIVGTVHNMWYE